MVEARDVYGGWDAMRTDGTTRRGFLVATAGGVAAGLAAPALAAAAEETER